MNLTREELLSILKESISTLSKEDIKSVNDFVTDLINKET